MSTTETTDGAATARGLSTAEAEDRLRRGESNTTPNGSTRSYATILRTNVFSFFNLILFVIGAALLAMGRYSDALISVGLGLINALISATQEIRAKHKLDQLQLLDRTPVVAVRDGAEVAVAPEEVVRGDVLRVRAGDQIVVDGPLLPGAPVEADESLLTGESDPVVKNPGDDLRSGSLCVAGEGHLLARDVGAASYAGRLTADARRATTDTTPLQRRITFVVPAGHDADGADERGDPGPGAARGLHAGAHRADHGGAVRAGALRAVLPHRPRLHRGRRADRRVAARWCSRSTPSSRCSNVDVLCTDKTGTLTTGRLRLTDVEPVGDTPGLDASAALGAFAAAVTVPNLTSAALAAALPAPGSRWAVRDEVPFASSLRWSGLATDAGVWVLGAPEALTPHLSRPIPAATVDDRTASGLRVLVLARATDPAADLRDRDGRPALPGLDPVAVVALADELRPEVAETIARFRTDAVALKVLSGDNPRTVAALATQAGLDVGEPVPGSALDGLDEQALDRLVARTTVFGRVAPEHKERIVTSLRRQGRYVAMIGDGVNDARALRTSHGQLVSSGGASRSLQRGRRSSRRKVVRPRCAAGAPPCPAPHVARMARTGEGPAVSGHAACASGGVLGQALSSS